MYLLPNLFYLEYKFVGGIDMDIRLRIADFLARVDMCGVESLTSNDIPELEEYIKACNESSNRQAETGEILVEDAIYDRLRDILRSLNPNSPMLDLWTEDEVSEEDLELETNTYIKKYPMKSINTIKTLNRNSLAEFLNALPYEDDEPFELFASLKENGHGVRFVQEWGNLIDGTSRGRSTAGRNLTRQFSLILGDRIESMADLDLSEVRGEIVLPFDNLDTARSYNPAIKTAFTGVSSMLRDSASPEETQLLDFVAYGFYNDSIIFNTKEEEYDFLESLGFTVPTCYVLEDITKNNIVEVLDNFLDELAESIDSYDYFTDGVVISVNDMNVFRQMGLETNGRYHLGNFALKVKYWAQDCYTGVIDHIDWTYGTNKFSPVAIVTDGVDYGDGELHGVPTASGNSVKRVPLYEPANILQLEAYPGNPLSFRYGGESGVVPCFPNGMALEKGYASKYINGELDYSEAEPECDEYGYYL